MTFIRRSKREHMDAAIRELERIHANRKPSKAPLKVSPYRLDGAAFMQAESDLEFETNYAGGDPLVTGRKLKE